MALWVGTSGYNYPEWKGNFYPEKISSAEMLPYYAARFSTVEINNTFYRMPNEKAVSGWSDATPASFKLTLKAPKRITHDKRLQDCAETTQRFLEVAATLGPKLGVLLEDLGRTGPALEAYQAAIGEDPMLADCHYNLARIYESLGKPQHAIRHLGQYRRLVTSETR